MSVLKRILGGVWRVLDGLRKALHLIMMLGVLLIMLAALSQDRGPTLPRSAALLVAPEGNLVDQLSGDPLDRALARAQGLPMQETLLKDLIDAIKEAKEDERIEALVLQLDGLTGAGLSKLQELAEEVRSFKESEKRVIAVGDFFTRNQYYLAAQADEIYMHPMGSVLVDGYSRYVPYFKSALDKLLIDYNVWVVGEYKSFVEPITRDDMSDADREASEAFLNALWSAYQADVTSARGLHSGALQSYADNAVELLAESEGNAAQMALEYGLVDELLTRDLVRERLKELVGEDPRDEHSFASIGHQQYVNSVRNGALGSSSEDKIAVVVASGTILDGTQSAGTIGGDSTARLIRRATEDENVRALVLRVDSGGGSAFASDVILRALEVFQATDRPLVVSMGSVAASGGYWISMGADEIWASPTTITGSIGVGGMFPTFQRSLDYLGIHVDGLGTTELAGEFTPTRELGEDWYALMEQSIHHSYEMFIGKVAENRGRSVAEIDRVAQGRVWIATDAQDAGLVDKLGNLDDAIRSAGELAGLEPEDYEVEYFEKELSFGERLAMQVARTAGPLVKALGIGPRWSPTLEQLLAVAAEPMRWLEHMNDPRGIYAYCFCDIR